MRVLIADLVTELNPVYEDSKRLVVPFVYEGERETDIVLKVSEEYLDDLCRRAAPGVTRSQLENFAFSTAFNRRAIPFGTMLAHSSALIYDGGAYLFSADSGVGKSFPPRLWLQAFGGAVHIMNDDKPVVRLYDGKAVAYGTPFDGGSGIALNESFPLRAIVFIERGEQNSVRVPSNREVLQKLYFQTAHIVSAKTAESMLENFDRLLSLTKFYVLTCNMDISAAQTAFDAIIRN